MKKLEFSFISDGDDDDDYDDDDCDVDDDDDDEDDDYEGNNNNILNNIERPRNSKHFLAAPQKVPDTRADVPKLQMCANSVQNVGRSARAAKRMLCGAKQQFNW